MKATKPKTLIVYEDNAPDLAAAAQALLRTAETSGVPVQLRTTSSVTIAEVLAASLFVFGLKTSDLSSYTELSRLFKGINLAGRRAVFFLPKGSKGADALRASLKDTDILLSSSDLYTGSDSAAIAAWMLAAMEI